MLDPDEADLVDATVEWARKHGQENRSLLSLTHTQWVRIWVAAWLRSVSRAVRMIFTGSQA